MLQTPIFAPTSGSGYMTTRLTFRPISTATVSSAAPRFIEMNAIAAASR